MTWFKVDDGFALHPKVIALPDGAVALWVRAGSWCAANLTDGHFPKAMLPVLRGKVKDAAALVAAGLWVSDKNGDGWWFHDWHNYQPSREKKLAERAASAERQHKRREELKALRDAKDPKGSHAVTDPVTDPVTNGATHNVSTQEVNAGSHLPRPDPSRPVVVVTNPSQSPNVTRESQPNDDDLTKIIEEIWTHRRRTVDLDWARRVAADIATRTPPDVRNRLAYTLTAIRNEPDRYLPTNTPDPWKPPPPNGKPPDDLAAAAQAARDAIRGRATA